MNIETNESPTTLLCKQEVSIRSTDNIADDNEHGYCSRERFVNDDELDKYAESSNRPKITILVSRSASNSKNVGTATHMTIDSGSVFDARSIKLFTETSKVVAIDHKKHRKSDHRKKKAKECKYCGKLMLNLSRHIRAMHTNSGDDASNAIVCAICEKTFQRVELLRLHNQRVHSEYKMKHECPICHLLVVNLNGHNRKTHINIRPFACKLCDRSYVWQSYLSAHEKRCHRRNDTDKMTETIITPTSDIEEKPNGWIPIDD